MKIVVLTSDAGNQRALVNKIQQHGLQLAGIVLEKKPGGKRKKMTVGQFFSKVTERLFLNKITTTWMRLLGNYNRQYPSFPDVEILTTAAINSEETVAFLKKIKPDLVVVSGTSMIKKPVLELGFTQGIINLHTGLSPYIKGGPNCTNWCISTGQFHLIGNTVMWIDAGIDSGNIISTEFTRFTGNEDFDELHFKVMEHAHDLYIRCMLQIAGGRSVPNVKQSDITTGTTYYTRQWTLKPKMDLIKNIARFGKMVNTPEYYNLQSKVTTVALI